MKKLSSVFFTKFRPSVRSSTRVHDCKLIDTGRNSILIPRKKPKSWGIYRRWLGLVLISSNHPLCSQLFRSEVEVKKEKIRQLTSRYPWIIHPLSTFRLYYEMWLCFLYTWTLIQMPFDSAFGRQDRLIFPYYVETFLTCDVLCWIDILIVFISGYITRKKKHVILDPMKIIWHYITGPYFYCDVLSSIPKSGIYAVSNPPMVLRGLINIALYLRIIRIVTLMKILPTIARFYGFKQSLFATSMKSLLGFSLVVHYTGCLGISVPRICGTFFEWVPDGQSWIYTNNLYYSNVGVRYIHAIFRSCAYLFSTRLLNIYSYSLPLDYIMCIIYYFIGKILVCSIWVYMAMAIISARHMEIKYHEVINQLHEYMRIKQLPLRLRERILEFFKYKYQRKYFREKLVTDLLSEGLKKEIQLHVCKVLLTNVSLFSELNMFETSELVGQLISEIYLSGDTIVHSGSMGEAMYFISSGTVAVYTHSGKEICHLQDGAYFGEISLVIERQPQVASVVAIEITQIYKLLRKDFDKYIIRNRSVFKKMVAKAERRMKMTMEIENHYKKMLFAEEFGK